jgi:hypothetical protein
VVNQVYKKDSYKRSYSEANTATNKLDSCINIVEEIIRAFSDNDITCKDCRKLVADIISVHLVNTAREGGLSTSQLTEETQYVSHIENI